MTHAEQEEENEAAVKKKVSTSWHRAWDELGWDEAAIHCGVASSTQSWGRAPQRPQLGERHLQPGGNAMAVKSNRSNFAEGE